MSIVMSGARTRANAVMGIDASTNSIAFSVIKAGKLKTYGKIMLIGSDVYERMHDAKIKTREIIAKYPADYICIEAAVMVRSVSVAVKLAYVFGVIIAELMDSGAKVVVATPVQWQSYISNRTLSKDQKAQLRKDNPGKSTAWYNNQGRLIRKQYTIDYFNKEYKVNISDDDVADSVGLAHYASRVLTFR